MPINPDDPSTWTLEQFLEHGSTAELTTAVVATAHGRDCTLIDIDERNIDLARQRVGMFLTVPEPDAVA